MTEAWRLDTLPCDILILIFDYCHAFDLVRLSEVCTRFYELIHCDTLWIKKSKRALATNQASKKFRERCNQLLCLRKKWHVSHNWQHGKYEKRILFSQKTKLMPWIHLTEDILWWSGGNQLCGFRRGNSFRQGDLIFNEDNMRSDICKFIVRDSFIITGHSDGSIKFWTKGMGHNHLYFNIRRAHSFDVNALDEVSQTIVSGAADGIVKIWNPEDDDDVTNKASATIDVIDRVWSTAIDPTGVKFAIGTSGNGIGPPLLIFDLERYSECQVLKHDWRRRAGILDMVWDSPNILLTCGYDTYIRKWDMRAGTCVSAWPDPTDATVYCISSDYQYTLVTGTQFNCKAVLWDQRQRNYVQLYFMNLRRISSPVYSLRFDSSHLYGATDQHLVELTFSGYAYEESNYRKILRYEWT